jgi:hypothetical protein
VHRVARQEGLTLRDNAAFEEWLLLHREHLARLRLAALYRLTCAGRKTPSVQDRQTASERWLAVRGSPVVLLEAYQGSFMQADQLHLYFEEIARRQDIWVNSALVQRLLTEFLED